MTISIINEIPELLSNQLSQYVEDHPNTDCDRVVTAAIVAYLKAQKEVQNV